MKDNSVLLEIYEEKKLMLKLKNGMLTVSFLEVWNMIYDFINEKA